MLFRKADVSHLDLQVSCIAEFIHPPTSATPDPPIRFMYPEMHANGDGRPMQVHVGLKPRGAKYAACRLHMATVDPRYAHVSRGVQWQMERKKRAMDTIILPWCIVRYDAQAGILAEVDVQPDVLCLVSKGLPRYQSLIAGGEATSTNAEGQPRQVFGKSSRSQFTVPAKEKRTSALAQ